METASPESRFLRTQHKPLGRCCHPSRAGSRGRQAARRGVSVCKRIPAQGARGNVDARGVKCTRVILPLTSDPTHWLPPWDHTRVSALARGFTPREIVLGDNRQPGQRDLRQERAGRQKAQVWPKGFPAPTSALGCRVADPGPLGPLPRGD